MLQTRVISRTCDDDELGDASIPGAIQMKVRVHVHVMSHGRMCVVYVTRFCVGAAYRIESCDTECAMVAGAANVAVAAIGNAMLSVDAD